MGNHSFRGRTEYFSNPLGTFLNHNQGWGRLCCEIWVKGFCHFVDAKECLYRTHRGISFFSFQVRNDVICVGLSGWIGFWVICFVQLNGLRLWRLKGTCLRQQSQVAYYGLWGPGSGPAFGFLKTGEKDYSASEWSTEKKDDSSVISSFQKCVCVWSVLGTIPWHPQWGAAGENAC